MYQISAHRVASISAIEDDTREKASSEFVRENLARRISALSASSLANLATSVGALSDIRHLEKKSREKQMDKEIQKNTEENRDIEEKQEETE